MIDFDEKAVQAANDILRGEKLLPSYLQGIEREEIFRKLGYANMHQYCVERLKLSDSQAYTYLSVARKCVKIPALQQALECGDISTQTARRILPVIETTNSESWIALAKEIPQKALEREVAKSNPKRNLRETIKPIAENLLEFRSGIDAETETLLSRCKELVSQNSKTAANWNSVLKKLASDFIKKNDPVKKAERNVHKAKAKPPVFPPLKSDRTDFPPLKSDRTDFPPLKSDRTDFPPRQKPKRYPPTPLRHQVFLRDQGRCQETLPNGTQCNQGRWIEIHHKRPLSEGGTHSLENLITLCSSHHAFQHSVLREPGKRKAALPDRAQRRHL